MIVSSEIRALIQLIDDPDENIFAQVKNQLTSFGSEVLPVLKTTQEENFDNLFQQRIEHLIQDIHFEEIKRELTAWINSDEKDLLKGALIIARYKYPNLNEEAIRQSLQEIKTKIWVRLSPISTAFEKVKAINEVLFDVYHYSANQRNYYSPLNSYLNTVVELKEGNPLSLSVLYSIIGNRLEIPIYGVNLPNHFILAYMDELNINMLTGNQNKYGVLFYIDAFNNGNIISSKEIVDFLETLNIEPQHHHFEPCTNSKILERMLANLINDYTILKREQKVEELTVLKNLFQ